MPASQFTERHPFMSLLQLLLLVLAGTVLFTIIGFVLGVMVYGLEGMAKFQEALNGTTTGGLGFLKIIQIASTAGTFIVPAIIFARLQGGTASYLQADMRISWLMLLGSIALMVSSGPFIEWTVTLNRQMHLPEFLKGVENWMLSQEEQLARLTKTLLIMDNVPDLLVNLLMIAILPAIGEEITFRGCLQRIFTRWTGNYHWGIWLAAILFSAIHMQFYGFLPRMLLGALFGYLFVWSNTIWVPILAHFVNNAGAVIMAYVYQARGESLDKLDKIEPSTWPVYLFSITASIVLMIVIYKKRNMQEGNILRDGLIE